MEQGEIDKSKLYTEKDMHREIVLPDINGYLIEMNNIDMFVNKIKVLDKNRLLMSYLGKNGRKLVIEKFSTKIIVKKFLKVYDELLLE